MKRDDPWAFLDVDVLRDVLSRTPARDMMQASCVCKHWATVGREDDSNLWFWKKLVVKEFPKAARHGENEGAGSWRSRYFEEKFRAGDLGVRYKLIRELSPVEKIMVRRSDKEKDEEKVLVQVYHRQDHFEIQCREVFSNPGVLQLQEVFVTDDCVGVVTEQFGEMSLDERLKVAPLSEEEARVCFQQLVAVAESLHESKSDWAMLVEYMKPTNIWLDESLNIKLRVDFVDLASKQSFDRTRWAGFIHLIAPEIFVNPVAKRRNEPVIWTCGMLLYTMLFGSSPQSKLTDSDPMSRLKLQRIMNDNYEYPPEIPLSPECKGLMQKCIKKEASERITLADLKIHPWFTTPSRIKEEKKQPDVLRTRPSIEEVEQILTRANTILTDILIEEEELLLDIDKEYGDVFAPFNV